MLNVIQIKRSTTAPDPSTLTGAGELSFSYTSNKLFIGSSNGVGSAALAIGGPGMFAEYALLLSPTFTGTPNAPTPLSADSSTRLATTAYVKAQGYITSNQNITVSGDASGSGTNAITLALSSTGVTAGTYTKLTVDSKGRVTNATILNATDIPTLSSTKISDFDTQVRTSTLNQFAIPTANVNLNGFKITNLAAPTLDSDAATKAYTDAASQGLTVKDSVNVASVANVNIASSPAIIDAYTLVANDRILLKDQTIASQNGIYKFTSVGTALTRTTDADEATEVKTGVFVFVTNGDANRDSGYYLRTVNPITLGTTALDFVIFSRAGQITGGAGLTKTGTSLDIGTVNTGRIVVNADSIDLGVTGIIAGNYTKLNVDIYGRAISGTNPTTLSDYGITDAQSKSTILDNFIASATTNGIPYYTNAGNTFAFYGLLGTANRVTSNISGGNITLDIASSYVGQTSITTLGTITTATWNGSTIGLAFGGTGNTTFTDTHIPYSDGTKLVGSANLKWTNATNTLTVNGTIDGCVVDGGQF